MARFVFLLVLLANLLFFAWAQGYFGARGQEGHEPQRLATQLAPEKIRLVGEPAAAPRAAGAPGAASGTEAAAPSSAAAASQVCRRRAPLPLREADQLKAALAKAAPDLAVSVQPVPLLSYWVYIPPLPNRQAADRKSAELKKLGVSDQFVVQDQGEDRLAISFGLFHTEQAAKDLVDALAKKGVHSAQIAERNRDPERATVELRGPADRLTRPAAELLAKAGTPISDCAEH